MAGEKISQLPSVPSPLLTDIIPMVQPAVAGTTYKVTFQQLSDLFVSSLVTPANGGIVYTDATQMQVLAPTSMANQMLQSGANSAPHWSTPTWPSASGTAGQIIISDGTNNVYSTPTFPVTAGAAGCIVISNGTNKINSTSLWPNTVGTTGQMIRSDGTVNAYSTATFADTYTASNILYSNGSNTVTGLATAIDGLLVTSNSGVPSILAGPGTTGNILQSNAAAAPSFSTATYPSVATSTGTVLRANGTNWIASTATFADTYTASNILYSNGANTITGLITAINGLLVTDNSGVPSILAGPGVTGRLLQSNAAAAPSFSTATFPSTAGTSGNIIISNGTNYISSTSLWPNTVGSAGKIIRSDGTTNAYTTATFADTYAASTLLYSNGANAVTGLTAANSASLVSNSSGVPAWTASLTNGQIIIGSTGSTPVPGTITGTGGVSVVNGAGTIAISGSGGGLSWTTVSGTSQALVANNGYVANNAGVVTFTLPATATVGDTYRIMGLGAGGWALAQNLGQTTHLGSSVTSSGVAGSLASTNRYDVIEVTCLVTNTEFSVAHVIGNITIV